MSSPSLGHEALAFDAIELDGHAAAAVSHHRLAVLPPIERVGRDERRRVREADRGADCCSRPPEQSDADVPGRASSSTVKVASTQP